MGAPNELHEFWISTMHVRNSELENGPNGRREIFTFSNSLLAPLTAFRLSGHLGRGRGPVLQH
jgi:hypothetical protein